MTQKFQEGFAKKEKTIGLFFDIASAFDKECHEGLIYKCIKYWLPYYIIRVIMNYLNGRSFVVKINQLTSEARSIQAGVS